MTTRWGILGAGGIAGTFTENLLAEGLAVQAVGARDGGRAQAFADRFELPTAHSGYDALVNDPDVDAIYVSTPHNFHLEHALLAIEAGKAVLIEKPVTVTAGEARQLAAAAQAAGVFAMEAMWARFLPSRTFVRDRIAAGAIGEVRAIQSQHCQLLNSDPKARLFNPELAGGALLDLGVYNVSFSVDLLGAPEAVLGRGTLTATGVDAETAMVLTHAGGAQTSAYTSMIAPGYNAATITGTEGYFELAPTFYNWTTVRQFAAEPRGHLVETFDPQPTSRGMHFQALELERCLDQGLTDSPLHPLADSIATLEVLDELRRQVGAVLPQDR